MSYFGKMVIQKSDENGMIDRKDFDWYHWQKVRVVAIHLGIGIKGGS